MRIFSIRLSSIGKQMNRNDFLDMISNPGPLNRQMIGEIYELIDIFPYFQSAHLLLLKGLYSNSDVKFENQLKNSAIHIGDREVLYWLLNKKTEASSQVGENFRVTCIRIRNVTEQKLLTKNQKLIS